MSKSRQSQIRSLSARFSPGQVIDWHAHDWLQLAFATTGVLHIQTQHQSWMVPTHRAVWIPPGLPHRIEMYGRVFMQTLYFPTSLQVFDEQQCKAVNVSSLMRELILHVCELGIISSDTHEHRCMIQVVASMAKKMVTAPFMLPLPNDQRATDVAKRILEDPSFPISHYLQDAGCSLRTLQRIFSTETGTSLGRWHSQAKLMVSLRLLSNNRSVTHVALDLGFESPSAFIHCFKKSFGFTPGKYLKDVSSR